MKLLSSAVIFAVMLSSAPIVQASSIALPGLGANPSGPSVSGLSSDAFMAVQYQVAYSRSVVGAGVVAGGPYYCATAGLLLYVGVCMGQVPFMPPNSALMLMAVEGFAAKGQIDPLSSLQNNRIYVFSGTRDTVVYQQAVDATASFFKQAGVPVANLLYVDNVPADHALLTPSFGNACAYNAAPYISHCQVKKQRYDQPGAMFKHTYGSAMPPAKTLSGRIVTFNQREFADASTGMAADAYAYVPAACTRGTSCKVHVAFHGCKQSAAVVKDDLHAKTSYNSWADSNNIIMLYPQVDASSLPFNPQGCWDWYSYSGINFALKSGSQLLAVNAMIGRLTSQPIQSA
jgi:poly(3-hydroxybutyrate) depolymerase